jgi:CcmD family protein
MSEWNFIVAAYGLTWLVLAGYSIYLLKRHARARRSFEDARNEGGAG